MTAPDYTRTCQVCDTEYQPALKKDGTPRKTKYRLCSKSCYDSLRWSESIGGDSNRVRSRRTHRPSTDGRPVACSVGGCGSFAQTKGMCTKHYQRVRKYGDPRQTSRGKRVTVPCAHCGRSFEVKPGMVKRRKFCSLSCAATYKAAASGKIIHGSKASKDAYYSARRRALEASTKKQSIDPLAVFRRDKWRCHLCGVKTPKSLRGTYEDSAPELEHIIPLSKGGTHTWGNVACSCRRCNLQKGTSVLGQLGLELA